MSLAPKFAGARRVFPSIEALASPDRPPHTIEVYLDYACPFSARMFTTLHTTLFPILTQSTSLPPTTFILRQQVQPWHPSSTLLHEAALSVSRLRPSAFWAYSAALFANQKEYFDVPLAAAKESRNDTYRRLARLAALTIDGLAEEDVYRLLAVPTEGQGENKDVLNAGNGVTGDLKLVVKTARLVGVHVSPTVVVDGVLANEVSSAWGIEEWEAYLGKLEG